MTELKMLPLPEHDAKVSDMHMSRYTLEWNGGILPAGTKLYTAGSILTAIRDAMAGVIPADTDPLKIVEAVAARQELENERAHQFRALHDYTVCNGSMVGDPPRYEPACVIARQEAQGLAAALSAIEESEVWCAGFVRPYTCWLRGRELMTGQDGERANAVCSHCIAHRALRDRGWLAALRSKTRA